MVREANNRFYFSTFLATSPMDLSLKVCHLAYHLGYSLCLRLVDKGFHLHLRRNWQFLTIKAVLV